jgi:hypothetical protein
VRQLISQLIVLQSALANPDLVAAKSVLLATLKAAHDARSLLSAKRPKRK